MSPTVPRLLLLTDRAQLAQKHLGRALVRTVAECVDAGLTHVVVRELDESPECRHALVARLAEIDGLTVLSAHDPDPAAAGVHLAADQPCNPLSTSLEDRHSSAPGGRTVGHSRPAGAWFGRSCHTTEEVRRAAGEGAAYATLSPFALTGSKPGYGPPLPREEYAGHDLPVLALGGITPANAADAIAAGAHGVAVMGAVMRAPEPAAVVSRLLEEVA